MQDLDFEELDKAVNSLMPSLSNDNSAKAAVQTAADDTPVDNSQNLAPLKPEVKSTSNTKPMAERPSTGRFMDVVHPSSDMRASLSVPQRSLSPSLAPMTNTEVKIPTVPEVPVENTQTAADTTSNWAGLSNYQEPKEVAESPFLPDTKVEKRPLGAFSNDNPTKNPVEALNTEVKDEIKDWVEDPKIESPENNNDIKPDIPDELDSSVLNIEANSSTHKNDIDMNKNPLSYNSASTSINQQYKEKPGSNKPTNGSIYDTSSFNTVAVKVDKKKSGWMVVIWIAILLVVGVGLGLAFYVYMPNFKLPF